MFKRIDESEAQIEGFSYEGKAGVETVTIPEGSSRSNQYVTITDSEGDNISVYRQDIPNLIKALQASYNHQGE